VGCVVVGEACRWTEVLALVSCRVDGLLWLVCALRGGGLLWGSVVGSGLVCLGRVSVIYIIESRRAPRIG